MNVLYVYEVLLKTKDAAIILARKKYYKSLAILLVAGIQK